MIECIRHRTWAGDVCHWLNIIDDKSLHLPCEVPQFALWVYDYVLLQSTLRTALALLPSAEILGLCMILKLAVNQNIFVFLVKYNQVCLVLF